MIITELLQKTATTKSIDDNKPWKTTMTLFSFLNKKNDETITAVQQQYYYFFRRKRKIKISSCMDSNIVSEEKEVN